MIEARKKYLKGQEESGLQVGDTVKITRKAGDREDGWDNVWAYTMNSAIGKIGKIINIDCIDINVKIEGISVDYGYPYFVLEKINQEEKTND